MDFENFSNQTVQQIEDEYYAQQLQDEEDTAYYNLLKAKGANENQDDNNNNNNEEILFEDNKPIQRTKSYSKRTKNVPKDVIYIYLLMRKYLNFC